MTDPWMDGARPDAPARHPRRRLALVLVAALVLPAAVIGLANRPVAETSIEMAAPIVARAQTSVEEAAADTVASAEATAATTAREPEEHQRHLAATPTTTAAPTTTAKPTTTVKPTTTQAPTTTAKPTTTTVKATSTTAAAKAAAAPASTTSTTARPATTTSAPTPVAAAPGSGATSAEAAFLACVRQRESGGNYSINTGNGYYGAYQFMQSTWNSAANMAGRPDLVGRQPNTVAPADQDAVALALYRAAGARPWGGSCH